MFRAWTICIVATVILSALITPIVYSIGYDLFTSQRWPYSRIFDRVILLILIIMFVIYRRQIGFDRAVQLLKWSSFKSALGLVAIGISVTVVTGVVALVFAVGDGNLVWRVMSWNSIAWRFIEVIPAALIISVLEEVIFRGLIFAKLRMLLGFLPAVLLSSALYASVHFLRPVKGYVFEEYSVFLGFHYLGKLFGYFLLPDLWWGWFGVFLAGCSLCVVFHRYGLIWLCIGLHAGWVIAVKVSGRITEIAAGVILPPGVERRYYMAGEWEMWLAILSVPLVLELLRRMRIINLPVRQAAIGDAPHRAQ